MPLLRFLLAGIKAQHFLLSNNLAAVKETIDRQTAGLGVNRELNEFIKLLPASPQTSTVAKDSDQWEIFDGFLIDFNGFV